MVLYIVNYNTVNIFKILFHQKVAAPLSCTMFCSYLNVNVSPFFFKEVDLSLSRRCQFILLQTQQYDVNSNSNFTNLKVISKGSYSKCFKNLRKAICVSNYEVSRWRSVGHIASPDGRRDIVIDSHVSCLNQKN